MPTEWKYPTAWLGDYQGYGERSHRNMGISERLCLLCGCIFAPFSLVPIIRNILIHVLLSSPLFIHWLLYSLNHNGCKISMGEIISHYYISLSGLVAAERRFVPHKWMAKVCLKTGMVPKISPFRGIQPWAALSLLHTWFHDASHVFIYFVLMYPTTAPPPTATLREYSDHVPPDFNQLRVICGASRFMAKIFSHGTYHPPTQRKVTRSKILPSYPTWAQRWLKSFRRHFSSPS